jgi:hypothetical protein
MTRLLSALGTACVLLLAVRPVLPAAEPIDLHWRFEKGQVLKYLLKHREVRTVHVGEEKFETTTTSEYDWEWTVQEVDEQGTATLELKLKGLRVACRGKDFEAQYDSVRANASNDDYKKNLFNLYDQLRFAGYRLKLGRDGRVAEVYGFDRLLGEVSPGANVADFHAVNLHDDSFRWGVQLLLGPLPEKPLAEGSRWEQPVQAKLAGFGDLSGRSEFTLGKEVKVGEHPCREMKQTGSETLELDMKWANAPLRGTLKTSKLTAAVRFDPMAGTVRSSEAQADYGGELKLGQADSAVTLKVNFQEELTLETQP